MKNRIKKVPIPLSAVMLGSAALGNLLEGYSEGIRHMCAVVAVICLVLLLLKLMIAPQAVKADMKNPIMASVSATFPMSLMLLSTYAAPMVGRAAIYLWYFAILLQVTLFIYFTFTFVIKLQVPRVFGSYFIVYAGIAMIAATAPVYGKRALGNVAFWVAFPCVLVMMVIVTYRYITIPKVLEAEKPLICIYTAPLSLCTVGYLQSVTPKSHLFVLILYSTITMLYLFALVKAIGYLRLPFHPSCASFTFPFVVSATASKQMMDYLAGMGRSLPVLHYIALIETVIAVVFVVYTVIRFCKFLVNSSL
ncbi:MAG: TDT family transporter [Lachnospiraceae bacterium]